MKNLIKYCLIVTFIGLFSCTDTESLLDKAETGDITADMIYKDIVLADQVLNDLYGRLPNIFADQQNRQGRFNADDLLDCGTIYGQHLLIWSYCTKYVGGNWSEDNCPLNLSSDQRYNDYMWTRNFAAIRACQNFIKRIGEVPFDAEYGYGEEQQKMKIAEAKFLEAFYYAELVRFYGGVPLIKEVLDLSSPEIKKPRNTYDECIDYIVSLCDEASENLPLSYPDNQLGRATKGAALALKSRMLLSAASPLFNNAAKPEDSPFRGQYDPAKWEKAARAAADVIKMNHYTLETDISGMFTKVTNPEVIFARHQPKAYWHSRLALPNNIAFKAGNGKNMSTFNMMKLYKVIKGGVAYDLTDPASGWDLQKPYANLDPRFYRDYCFNTAKTRGKNVQMWALGTGTTLADVAPNLVTAANNNSYLVMIKFADLTIDGTAAQKTFHNYQFMRFAEVLLNYAEAMNEAFGPEVDPLGLGLTATGAVNLIRRRTTFPAKVEYLGYTGTMPDFPTGLSQEEFRKEVRQERTVELNMEECQFFDLRRWRMPVETQKVPQFLIPTLNVNGGVKTIVYSIVDQTPRAFANSWYFLPIPLNQILINPLYVQNPGYQGSPEAEN